MSKRGNKRRRVGIWLDLDWGLKREQETYAGCQQYADEVGWECVLDPALARTLKPGPGGPPYDGVIGRVTKSLSEAARKAGVPAVNIWASSPLQGIPSVIADDEAAGVMAAEHLLGRGFRSFGFLGFQRLVNVRRQLQGFRGVIKREGCRCSAQRFPHTLLEKRAAGWEHFVGSLQAWVDTWELPIGILVCEDIFSRFLIDVCRAKGLHIPTEVAIVGVGNDNVVCASPPPSLTSIDMGHAQKGYHAAALLDRLMCGEVPPSGFELVAPAELIPRQSSDVFASDDPLVVRALRFIAEHSHTVMPVTDVAAEVATTRRTLERRFRASVGRSIAEEITRLRLSRAKRRMVETDTPFKTVAIESGFRNANHFSKVFTRVEGLTPSQYREARQKLHPEREG